MANVSAAFHVFAECSNRPGDKDYRVTNIRYISSNRVIKICTLL